MAIKIRMHGCIALIAFFAGVITTPAAAQDAVGVEKLTGTLEKVKSTVTAAQ